jgi:hypothetical protein
MTCTVEHGFTSQPEPIFELGIRPSEAQEDLGAGIRPTPIQERLRELRERKAQQQDPAPGQRWAAEIAGTTAKDVADFGNTGD